MKIRVEASQVLRIILKNCEGIKINFLKRIY